MLILQCLVYLLSLLVIQLNRLCNLTIGPPVVIYIEIINDAYGLIQTFLLWLFL